MEENTNITAENIEQVAEVQPTEFTDTQLDLTDDTQEEVKETTPDEADKVVKPQKDVSQTKAFSERLKKEQEKIKAEMDKQYSDLLNALKGLGLEGTPQEIAMRIKAEQEGVSYEDLKASEEAKQKEFEQLLNNHPDIVKARQIEMENQARSDLESIKKVFPEVDVEKIELDEEGNCNLGNDFLELMQTGKVSAVAAYAAQKEINALTKKEPLKSMGDIKSGSVDVEKDFNTEEEFAKYIARNPDYLDNDENLNKMFKKALMDW